MKISAKQYAITLYELTDRKSESQINEIISKFVMLMKKVGDFKKINDVVSKFEEIYNKNRGILKIVVTTTRKLSDEEKNSVIEFIKTKYNVVDVEVSTVIDKNIKGGIIIRVGDEIIDGSVFGRLRVLRSALKK